MLLEKKHHSKRQIVFFIGKCCVPFSVMMSLQKGTASASGLDIHPAKVFSGVKKFKKKANKKTKKNILENIFLYIFKVYLK
jgi:hypothetical protein